MVSKIINNSNIFDNKIIGNLLIKNFGKISKDWVFHQWNYLNKNYDAFNDLTKYFIVISLVRNTLKFFHENGIKYNYNDFYSDPQLEIPNFKITELAKEFDIPIETARRKIDELEKLGFIIKNKKKIILDRSVYKLIKPKNQIRITSKYISKVTDLMKKNNLLNSSIDEIKINEIIQDNFSITWLWFYQLQIPIHISWKKKVFGDFNSFYVWGTCGLNEIYNNKKLPNASISENGLDDYMINILDAGGSGLNAMSISEMTKIPRATVMRKLNKLKKDKIIKSDSLKQYYVSNLTPLKITPIIQKHFEMKSVFITKIINLLILNNLN